MYIDIYFNVESDIERDLLEERLDEILKGKGEVTGGILLISFFLINSLCSYIFFRIRPCGCSLPLFSV